MTSLHRRVTGAVLLFAALALGGCVKPRDINQPIAGALEYSFPDSSAWVISAVERALIDETIDIGLVDRPKGLVESRYEDIGSLRASTSREDYAQNERMVRFRFFARPILGGTKLYGEAVYRPTTVAGGRAMERMVPSEHAAREVLTRLYTRVDELLRTERQRRTQPDSLPPGAPGR